LVSFGAKTVHQETLGPNSDIGRVGMSGLSSLSAPHQPSDILHLCTFTMIYFTTPSHSSSHTLLVLRLRVAISPLPRSYTTNPRIPTMPTTSRPYQLSSTMSRGRAFTTTNTATPTKLLATTGPTASPITVHTILLFHTYYGGGRRLQLELLYESGKWQCHVMTILAAVPRTVTVVPRPLHIPNFYFYCQL
jgi:hypothetical protein